MLPTPRLVGLAALGALPVALAGPRAWAVSLGYDLVVLALWLADFLLAPGRDNLAATRTVNPVLGLGRSARVGLTVRNTGRTALALELRDGVPRELGESPRGRLRLEPGGRGEWSYEVAPLRRGAFDLGPVTVRSRGPLGLAWRQFVLPVTDRVKVYPDLRELPRYQLQAVQGWLLEDGRKRVRRAGAGTEFVGIRDYVAGDDFRAVNWTASARRGRLVSNLYDVERSQTVIIALDAGRLMTPLAGSVSKLDRAVEAALMLAYVAATRRDRVGLLVFSDRVREYVPPASGRRAYVALAERLHDLEAEPVEADYRRAIAFLRAHQRKRSLVCLFSDLIDARGSAELVAALAALSPRHLPVCIALRDPQVADLAGAAALDSETVYRKGVAELVLAQRERALAVLRRHGAVALDVLPRDLTPAAVNAYLAAKNRGRL